MAKNAQQIKALVNEIFLFGDGSFDQFATEDLIDVLTAADTAYHSPASQNVQPILSDENYDALRQYVEMVDPTNSYFLGVGSQVRGGKVKLPYPMGSLTQAYQGDTQKWVAQYKLQSEDIMVTEKLDGCSALIVYGNDGKLQIAYSRGDGIEGADITRHVSKIKSVPKQVNGPLVVRAEILFTKSNWNIVKTQIKRSGGAFYKNARNATAGLMNASESDPIAYQHLSVVAYEILGQELDKDEQLNILASSHFTIPAGIVLDGYAITDDHLTSLLNKMREDSQYEIDGIVLDVCKASLRKNINPTKDTLNPEFSRKFKVADASNIAIATVVEVEWNISKNGYLKPRVKIEPVELVGVTVQHATGFNAKFIQDNNIGPGAKVRITRSGDVIPFLIGVVTPAKFPQMPEMDATWTETGVDLVIKNANNNATVQLEQLIDFAAKIGIEHIGEGNMKAIYDAGYTTIDDFVKMSAVEIGAAIGSTVVGKKIAASKTAKLHNQPWYIIAGAHPVFGRGIGQRKMKKLYDAFEGNIKMLSDVNSIASVEGFDTKTATKIQAGYVPFLEFATNNNIVFSQYEAPKGGEWTGKSVCFTGVRIAELEAKIINLGGKIASGVSSKLTYLVAIDPTGNSGKLNKARDIGVPILNLEQISAMLE